jgi:hypothetical protein
MPHTSPTRRKPALAVSLIPLAALLVAAALGLVACGGSSNTATTTTNAAATNAPSTTGSSSTGTPGTTPDTTPGRPNPARFSAMRECLAKKGITLPQRTPGSHGGFAGGRGGTLPKGMSRAQFAEALKSCGGGFNGPGRFAGGAKGFRNQFNNPRFRSVLVRFSACLRQHGIDVGEPNTSGKGPIFDTKGINTGSPQFRAASTACRSMLLGALGSTAHPGAAASG